jgi:hypothetical protein
VFPLEDSPSNWEEALTKKSEVISLACDLNEGTPAMARLMRGAHDAVDGLHKLALHCRRRP